MADSRQIKNVDRTSTHIRRIKLLDFKGFANFSATLDHVNLLTGPNNCGKSTVLQSLRLLALALRSVRTSRPTLVSTVEGIASGYQISLRAQPITLSNVHNNYRDVTAVAEFELTNRNSLRLEFPPDGGCVVVPRISSGRLDNSADFKRHFPIRIGIVPVLGPLDPDEELVQEKTVLDGLSTHRASRHFRNYWYHFPDDFSDFAKLLEDSWPGMEIERPEQSDPLSKQLIMCVKEQRITREIAWAGFGFQIWCQLLTHLLAHRETSLLVLDEPEIYLHPDLQRRILRLLRPIGPDIIVATHSMEIVGDADPSEILLVDKARRVAERLRDDAGVQKTLDVIGSVHNLVLTRLSRNRRVLFVEGKDDERILRRFAIRLGVTEVSHMERIAVVESGGFARWQSLLLLAEGIERTLGATLALCAVFDADFYCQEELDTVRRSLSEKLAFVHIHDQKEIENFMLSRLPIQRAVDKLVRDRIRRNPGEEATTVSVDSMLWTITEELRPDTLAQLLSKRSAYFQRRGVDAATTNSEVLIEFESKWQSLDERLKLVPGKRVLERLRAALQEQCRVTLTDIRIVDEFAISEIPPSICELIERIRLFSQQ